MKKIILLSIFSLNLFALNTGDKIPQSLSNYIGLNVENKIYIIDFFASWCNSCKKELPLISKIHNSKNSIYQIIGIDVDKNVNKGIAFQKKLNLKFKIINDPQSNVISVFNPIGMPTIYYVKNRTILKIIPGAVKNIDQQILSDIKNIEGQ